MNSESKKNKSKDEEDKEDNWNIIPNKTVLPITIGNNKDTGNNSIKISKLDKIKKILSSRKTST